MFFSSIFNRKKNITLVILFLIILLLQSCDQPNERRRLASVSDSTSSTDNTTATGSTSGVSTINTVGTSGTIITTTTTDTATATASATASLPAEFASCNVYPPKYNFNHALIGNFNVCNSNESKSTKILFQAKSTISDYRVCFFPTAIAGTTGSVMIGDPQCISTVTAEKISQIEFSINRPDFTNKAMTGVIIVKDMPYGEVTPYHTSGIPTYTMAYQDCMNYLYYTGDDMACQRFKAKGQYIYISFQ
ncbi:MAG: hypothetical protein HQK51_02115 [Oligoflexia bacterium]|nr:hypothetical protein [Oligoflexia bacterium]